MKYNKIIILFTLTTILFLSGCGGTGGSGVINYYTGSNGIDINFLKNVPPNEVYEGQTFLVMVQLENKGAHTLNPAEGEYGVISLNYDKLYFSEENINMNIGTSKQENLLFNLQGKSEGWPKGETLLKEISYLKVNEVTGTRETPKTQISASACYPYKTVLTQTICMDFDFYKVDDNPSCTNRGIFSYSGQGAPIVISSIDAKMIPGQGETLQPTFKIKLRNADDGIVFARNEGVSIIDTCSAGAPGRTPKDINSVTIKAELSTTESELSCIPNPVQIINGEGQTTCFMKGTTPGASSDGGLGLYRNYETPLTVTLEYIYRKQTETSIEIQRTYLDPYTSN